MYAHKIVHFHSIPLSSIAASLIKSSTNQSILRSFRHSHLYHPCQLSISLPLSLSNICKCTLAQMSTSASSSSSSGSTYKFGGFTLDDSQVFYVSPSNQTYATVNLKPIADGHVLVCPIRVVERVHDLTADELSDLINTVCRYTYPSNSKEYKHLTSSPYMRELHTTIDKYQHEDGNEDITNMCTLYFAVRYLIWCGTLPQASFIGDVLQEYYHTTAQNLAIQDGKAAGQSVPHVHMHVLPRVEGDFQRNDDVYDKLDKHDARPHPHSHDTQHAASDADSNSERRRLVVDDNARKARTKEVMAEEAKLYRRVIDEYRKKHPQAQTQKSNI